MKQKKEKRITIRLNEEQYASICNRAETAHMAPAAFVRAAAMRHKITVVESLPEFTRQLQAIGNNLNQLTVLAHTGRVQLASLQECTDHLGELYRALDRLTEQECR